MKPLYIILAVLSLLIVLTVINHRLQARVKPSQSESDAIQTIIAAERPQSVSSSVEPPEKLPNGMRITIEKLTPPEKPLEQTASEQIIRNIIDGQSERNIDGQYNIVCKSEMPKKMVAFSHPFFGSVYQAYADHRPFVLSPDMVWLLIEQGFARHMEHNHEALRRRFVEFNGKMSLVLVSNDTPLDAPREIWEREIGRFVKEVGEKSRGNLPELLTADFSTTTPVERIASQITLMNSVHDYFEFIEIHTICGIPEVILLGTPEDWQKILDRTQQLRKYDLEWWTDELEPVLEKLVAASKGEQDTEFWCDMFRCHEPGGGCIPGFADGWIARFYPYNENGTRRSLKMIGVRDDSPGLPAETVTVEMKHITSNPGGDEKTRMLELAAGFVGTEQDLATYALKPKIGWFIRIKNDNEEDIVLPNKDFVSIRVSKVPQALAQLRRIKMLEIEFIDRIEIPEWMGRIEIEQLTLQGKTNEEGIRRIRAMFPHTQLRINNKKPDDESE